MDFCPGPPTFAADPRVVGSAPVEHLHKNYLCYIMSISQLARVVTRIEITLLSIKNEVHLVPARGEATAVVLLINQQHLMPLIMSRS